MSGVDLQPSPFSTLSFDGGIATATPEPTHPTRPHELAGIALDLGDSFDFVGIDDSHGRPSAGDELDDTGGGVGGSDAGDPHHSAYGGLLDDLQDPSHHHHLHQHL